MSQADQSDSFCGVGRWRGEAEVYAGDGRFLSNAADDRHVRATAEDGRTRIDLAFVGPFELSRYYPAAELPGRRLYQGPANYGYGEPLGRNLVDASAYWPSVGLSQRLFLMVLPDGNQQLSLALLCRGEQLLYAVVGDYRRVVGDSPGEVPGLVPGISYDLARDPTAGRRQILLHRSGQWTGELTTLDGSLRPCGGGAYRERVSVSTRSLSVELEGDRFGASPVRFELLTDEYAAWTPGGPVVGSYSMSGGRALSGTFHHLANETRVWRREVVQSDGAMKAVVHIWYRGGERIAVDHGVLRFEAACAAPDVTAGAAPRPSIPRWTGVDSRRQAGPAARASGGTRTTRGQPSRADR